MVIGIDASRAFLRNRTGIEEYAKQVISHLRGPLRNERVVLYVRKRYLFQGLKISVILPDIDMDLPASWSVRGLWAPRFWTHVRLSIEMLLHSPDILFVPAHTVPLIHPTRSFVTVHGLEYEFSKGSYSFWERIYMRSVIRFSCRAAMGIISVSENTKRDLIRLYGVSEEKIRVVYEGKPERRQYVESRESEIEKPYLLFIGRIEERKNISRIVEAFGILKGSHGIPHRLILAGKKGYGYADIKQAIEVSGYRGEIVETGYVSEKKKVELLRNADVFLFPSLYEGFGLPVVEAQAAGVPVVTSRISSLPEIGGMGALYTDPMSVESIADRTWDILSNPGLRDGIIVKGRENVKRFGWEKCSEEISDLLLR
ncbi:MAG: glycosyltransferase family 4 protein [Candidatus Moranbacteria bacterium]|nr:glycosyltransferase family 4 protein [Candidatus Moranbacteria bacterium]